MATADVDCMGVHGGLGTMSAVPVEEQCIQCVCDLFMEHRGQRLKWDGGY